MNSLQDLGNAIASFIRRENEDIRFRLGLSALASQRGRYSQIKSLYEADLKVFSQFGEDGIIDFLLYKLGIDKPSFIEIGTGDYSESNTRFLFQRTNCKGKIFDCDPNLDQKAQSVLGDYYWKGDLEIVSSFITCENVLELLLKPGHDRNITEDIFSLDIDGNDYWVLEKLMPFLDSKIIICEYSSIYGGAPVSTVYDPSFQRFKYHSSGLCFGASLAALNMLMKRFDYVFVGSNLFNHNGFWVKSSLVANLGIPLQNNDEFGKHLHNYARESRDSFGNLDYLTGQKKLETIRDCLIYDFSDNSVKKVSQILIC